MTRTLKYLLTAVFAVASGVAKSQSLDPAQLLKPSTDSWPTYSGDYSGRRYSPLIQINQATVKNLSLAFVSRLQAGPQGPPGTAPVIVAGEGKAGVKIPSNFKGFLLPVDVGHHVGETDY